MTSTMGEGAEIPTFGRRLRDCDYHPRPSVYAVVIDGLGRVAVVRTVKGCCFLTGGGIEPGESPEVALAREVREECGRDVRIIARLGEAVQFVDAGDEGRFAKHSTFYRAEFDDGANLEAIGEDELRWLTPEEAARLLHHESHAWIVRRVCVRR